MVFMIGDIVEIDPDATKSANVKLDIHKGRLHLGKEYRVTESKGNWIQLAEGGITKYQNSSFRKVLKAQKPEYQDSSCKKPNKHDDMVEALTMNEASALMQETSKNRAKQLLENKMSHIEIDNTKPRETIKVVFGIRIESMDETQCINAIEKINKSLQSYEQLNLNHDHKECIKSTTIAKRTLELKETLQDVVKQLDSL